ncbi:MAG: heme-binding protein [Pseudomonadota bacterium]|nr:heme-binding protein [Pseudomonadota bacterium]
MGEITLAQANKIIDVAVTTARQRAYQPMAVVVLDSAGHIRALQREDGASMFRIDIATGKAWAAVGMGAASRALSERAKQNPIFFGGLAATAHGKFLAQTGAVLIKDAQGHLLGAIGASGGTGDEDEAICIAGVQALGLDPT